MESGPVTDALVTTAAFDALLGALADDGRRVIGPRVRDGAVVLDDLDGVADLPVGWADEQSPGRYRLRRRDDDAHFGFTTPSTSWKPFLHPAREVVFRARLDGAGFEVTPPDAPEPLAFIGVRACDLAGIAVQDRVLGGGRFVDAGYAARRSDVFVVAADCGESGPTCFCGSMGTGPTATTGFDLAVGERLGDEPRFFVRIGSARGAALLERVEHTPATEADRADARAAAARAVAGQSRSVAAGEVAGLLARNLEHPRWDEVAERCLACTNCTLVCPTCFCTSVEDSVDLAGTEAVRSRRWDSCFTLDFTALGGAPVRGSVRSRYRQWLTHKLSTWQDQFGELGCVGCGRCLTWCPVGIDLTEEVAAIGATDGAENPGGTPS
ncbi:MAG: 4Fe-4S dicluster domain-containing protein [Microthrixaceae bacterium]|nr:4Fe-4S dicluster domain-containing protein [Microthrixaceae bacterium]